MADNVLKAIIDAIAEADNELGGLLITRLRQAHEAGRDDGQTAAGNPTRLTSPVAAFQASDVGKGLDIIRPVVGAATGLEGSYTVATFVDPQNVTLARLGGGSPSFGTVKPVRWRFTTLRVETTFGFPANDASMALWVGEEPAAVPYGELVQTPGAQEFRGLGGQRVILDGVIAGGAPTVLSTVAPRFVAGDVGKAVWIYPTGSPNGNEGPQRITTFTDSRNVVVTPGGLSTTQTGVRFAIKDYLDDTGYLSRAHREDAEVVDGSRSVSALDRLRRALLVAYATEDELDRVGRNLVVTRPRGMDDETYRRLLQVLTYLPRGTLYGIEIVLGALFPGQAWSVYEDLINFPCTVFVLLEDQAGNSTVSIGKTFLDPTGADVTAPIALANIGQRRREKATPSSTTTVDTAHTAIRVYEAVPEPFAQTLEMGALPSADSPAWTFVATGGVTEGNCFSVASSRLAHTQPAAPTVNGGRYKYAPTSLAGLADDDPLATLQIEAWWKGTTLTAVGGYPWHLGCEDPATGKDWYVFWDDGAVVLAESDETIRFGPVTPTSNLADGKWHRFIARRTITPDGSPVLTVTVDGQVVFDRVSLASFSAGGVTGEASFGYFGNGNSQNWTVHWDRVVVRVEYTRNHTNVRKKTGTFTGSDDHLVVTGTPFHTPGDLLSHPIIRIHNGPNRVRGKWQIASFYTDSDVSLEGNWRADEASVQTVGGQNFVTLEHWFFVPEDLGKTLGIAGSALGNSGTRTVLEVITPQKVRVSGAAYVAEANLDWGFVPDDLEAASGVLWEMCDASFELYAAPTLTVRDAFLASLPVQGLAYTSVLSAQILRDEFVVNTGVAPNGYFPFYLFDVDRATRGLIDTITAAGIIAEYRRTQ